MNATMKLTLDGLIHTLRRTAHDLADRAEHRYREAGENDDAAARPSQSAEGNDDGRTRR